MLQPNAREVTLRETVCICWYAYDEATTTLTVRYRKKIGTGQYARDTKTYACGPGVTWEDVRGLEAIMRRRLERGNRDTEPGVRTYLKALHECLGVRRIEDAEPQPVQIVSEPVEPVETQLAESLIALGPGGHA